MHDWSRAKRVLCIRLDNMGDLLMTTPALRSLKDAVHGRHISLLTTHQGAMMAESIPLFDDVISYGAPWVKHTGTRTIPSIDLQLIEKLKLKKFDAAVIFTFYHQSPLPAALMCFLAEIPLRAAHCRENPYGLLTHWIKEEEPEKLLRHEVRRHLDLVHQLGARGENLPLIVNIEESERRSVEMKLQEMKLDENKNWIVIHPGATEPSRRYHEAGFANVADMLVEKLGKEVLFTGLLEERGLIDEIQARMKQKSVNLAGTLSLKEMIALLSVSPLLISNNSGPVHIAAALGTPVIVLYALTNPQHTPWMVPNHVLYHHVSCHTCNESVCPMGTNACLNNVLPETVFNKARELLLKEPAPCYDFEKVHPLFLN